MVGFRTPWQLYLCKGDRSARGRQLDVPELMDVRSSAYPSTNKLQFVFQVRGPCREQPTQFWWASWIFFFFSDTFLRVYFNKTIEGNFWKLMNILLHNIIHWMFFMQICKVEANNGNVLLRSWLEDTQAPCYVMSMSCLQSLCWKLRKLMKIWVSVLMVNMHASTHYTHAHTHIDKQTYTQGLFLLKLQHNYEKHSGGKTFLDTLFSFYVLYCTNRTE